MDEGVEIVLGRPRRLKFRYPDMRALEDKVGKPLGDIVGDLGRVSIRSLELIIWAGLRHEKPSLKPEDIQGLLGEYFEAGSSLSDLLAIVRQAILASGFFGGGKDEGQEKT